MNLHMKCHILFSLKKYKSIKMLPAAVVINTLRVKTSRRHLKQEAHGPRFAHLSDKATADMQMLSNIFPILSSQLMKISSFEQFLAGFRGKAI